MGSESDECVFWSEKEDGYGEVFTYHHHHHHHHHTNHCFDTATAQTILHEQSNSKREREEDRCEEWSPLGLRLRKTPSFLSLLQRSLSKGKHIDFPAPDNQSDKPTTKKDHFVSLSTSDKLKASNFPATFLKIGSWQRITRHEGDLTAKLYYAKRKLVWEVLDGALKSKIEIQWCNIIAIRAITPPDNEPGTLEIELNQPPLFYREINPQPRKHTLWQQASDFTGGQAPIWRRHYVRFPPGVLDKHYEKLLQCDERLSALSHKPFPSHESPYFDPTMFGISELSLGFSGYGSTYGAPDRLVPNSNNPFGRRIIQTPWGQEPIYPLGDVVNINQGQPFNMSSSGNQIYDSQNYQQPNIGMLSDIENHLLGEHQVGTDLLEPSNNVNVNRSSDDQVMQYQQYINPMFDDVYAEPYNWMLPQNSNDAPSTVNHSQSPFMYPHNNPTNQDLS